MRKVLVSFASQISAALFSPKLLFAIGMALACGSASMAQVSFLGAQRTVTTTGLSGPNGAATDSSGNLYVADTGNNRVVKISPTGTQTVVSVSPLTLSFQLRSPSTPRAICTLRTTATIAW